MANGESVNGGVWHEENGGGGSGIRSAAAAAKEAKMKICGENVAPGYLRMHAARLLVAPAHAALHLNALRAP
jgi:hypothetical protein